MYIKNVNVNQKLNLDKSVASVFWVTLHAGFSLALLFRYYQQFHRDLKSAPLYSCLPKCAHLGTHHTLRFDQSHTTSMSMPLPY